MAACFPKKHWCISVLILVTALAASCYPAKTDKQAVEQNSIKKAENLMDILILPAENPNKNTQAVSTNKIVPVNTVLQVKPRFTGRRQKHYRKVMKFTRRKNQKKWNRIRPNRKQKRPIKISKSDIKTQEIQDKLKLQHIDPVVNELPKRKGLKKSKHLKKKKKDRKLKSLSDVVEALTKEHKKDNSNPLSTDTIRKMLLKTNKPNRRLRKRKQKQSKSKTEMKKSKPLNKKKKDGKLKSLSDVVDALTKEHKKGSGDPLSTDAIRKMLLKTNKRLNRRKQKQGKQTKLTLKNFPMKKNENMKQDKSLNKAFPKNKINLRPTLKGTRRRNPSKGKRRDFRKRLRSFRGRLQRKCFQTKKGKVCKRVRTFGKGRRIRIKNRRRLLARQRLRALKLGKRRQLGINRNALKTNVVKKHAKQIANTGNKSVKAMKGKKTRQIGINLNEHMPNEVIKQTKEIANTGNKLSKRTFGKGRRNKLKNRRTLLARQRLRALKLGKRRQIGKNRNKPKTNADIKQAKKIAKRRQLRPRLRNLRGRLRQRCKGKVCKRVRTFGKGRLNKIKNRRRLLARQRLRAVKLGKRRQAGLNRNAPKTDVVLKEQAKKIAKTDNKSLKTMKENKLNNQKK